MWKTGLWPTGKNTELTADVERVLVFERLGKGTLTQDELAGWLRGGE